MSFSIFSGNPSFVFSLANASEVDIQLFNLNGQSIESIVENEWLSEGQHSIRYNAKHLLNGMYYMVIKSGKQIETRKMLLLE